MHWYNPKTGETESVPAPTTDEAALEMLLGTSISGKLPEIGYVTVRVKAWKDREDLRAI